MTTFREWVREGIPGSTEFYEHALHVRRRSCSRKEIARVQADSAPIRLDIGGGGRRGSRGWLTVDTAQGCDLYWDLREGIPFDTDTVDAIYSSHMLEHLTYRDGQELLAECWRVMRPGGLISIAVPNARLYIEGYMGYREIPVDYFGWEPALNRTTAIDAVNYVAYMGGEHKYLFDEENLVHRLARAGFENVRARAFDSDLDMPEREYESIYAEGWKPA
jgi:predicted SAM-dependent methyltransferase